MHGGYDEHTRIRGIPVTGPSRTLLDLSQVCSNDELERALRTAERLQLTDTVSVVDLLERYPGRRGSAAIKRLTAVREIYRGVTRSELEERFRQFLRAHELADPEWNVRLELGDTTIEVDCLWRDQRVVVELDGYGYHAGLDAFERDRLRDRLLQRSSPTGRPAAQCRSERSRRAHPALASRPAAGAAALDWSPAEPSRSRS
jgi:very-short-patch-repair endonuclease